MARQTFFKTGKLLTGKFDLSVESSVSKSMVAKSLPSTPMQQTLMSVTETFKSFKELRDLYIKSQLHFKPKPPGYLKGSKLFKVAYPNSGGLRPKLVGNHLIFSLGLTASIGTLIIGWNQGFKSNSNLGKVNNQKFVKMPLGKLKNRLKKLCDLHGIKFAETEEAYTSKASFLDGDSLPRYGEKPSGWKASGKRIKRGLYRSANGTVVNADLNGAANILRKVVSKLGVSLDQLNRRCLTTVARVRLWVLPKLALSAESQCL
ncbi:zinc ribbon domain-containing protein [Microcoleus sp. A006_D1]